MFSERLSNIWHSATFRLGIRFMTLFALSFLIVGAFIYWQTESYMERELRSLVGQLARKLESPAATAMTPGRLAGNVATLLVSLMA